MDFFEVDCSFFVRFFALDGVDPDATGCSRDGSSDNSGSDSKAASSERAFVELISFRELGVQASRHPLPFIRAHDAVSERSEKGGAGKPAQARERTSELLTLGHAPLGLARAYRERRSRLRASIRSLTTRVNHEREVEEEALPPSPSQAPKNAGSLQVSESQDR
ncbi:unnamed protein product [Peniophora sp. CBMAI 1063]|nr:unnamed protein product [Peniophora sp. CBMAI 1063]